MTAHFCPSNPCPICYPVLDCLSLNSYEPIPNIITDPTSDIKNDSVRINTDDLSSLVNQNKALRAKITSQDQEIFSLKEKNKKLAEKLGRLKEILK